MPNSFEDINPNAGEVRVAFARMEAKLDVALAQHGAKLEQHGSEIGSLREDLKEAIARHDADNNVMDIRVRAVEATPTVTPRTLGAVVVGAAGVLGALYPLLDRIYN